MTNDWIIDVLTDLKKFSAKNEMISLTEQLDDTIMVAATELSYSKPPMRRMVGKFAQTGRYAKHPCTGGNA